VDEAPHRVTAQQPQQPQNHQYHSDRPKHAMSPFGMHSLPCRRPRTQRPAPGDATPRPRSTSSSAISKRADDRCPP
jgi:hypothetical protein